MALEVFFSVRNTKIVPAGGVLLEVRNLRLDYAILGVPIYILSWGRGFQPFT